MPWNQIASEASKDLGINRLPIMILHNLEAFHWKLYALPGFFHSVINTIYEYRLYAFT